MGLIVRTVLGIVFLFIVAVVAFMGWVLVDPFLAVVMEESPAAAPLTEGMLVVRVAFLLALPGIALAVIFWVIFGSIATDTHARYRRR